MLRTRGRRAERRIEKKIHISILDAESLGRKGIKPGPANFHYALTSLLLLPSYVLRRTNANERPEDRLGYEQGLTCQFCVNTSSKVHTRGHRRRCLAD